MSKTRNLQRNQTKTLAAKLLEAKKLQILKKNLKTKFGKIDILARDGKTLVIAEAKAKSYVQAGRLAKMLTPAKQRKLILLAHELGDRYQSPNVRVDVITVDRVVSPPKLRHWKGLIEFNG